MHLARAGLIALVAIGCSRPEGLWRDQYTFVADDGTVLSLGLNRQSDGFAEVKGWLGRDGAWQTTAFHRFPIARRDANDRAAVLATWAKTPGVPARAQLDRTGDELAIDLRLPAREVRVRASKLLTLGTFTDPEGTSVYSATRAQMADADTVWNGWLIAEETPANKPRRPFVDYGEFALVMVAGADREPLVIKRSRRRPAFDQAFSTARAGRRARARTTAVSVEIATDHVELELPDWNLRARLAILDRDQAPGTAPDGSAVVYETLLLGGDYAGIAFVVRPEQRTTP